jgi:hypothetical protein
MPRGYPYGKVPSSLGLVVSERFERPMVDCGYCSGQMLARTVKAGVSNEGRVEGHIIRSKGGRAHWAGNTASELRLGLTRGLSVPTMGVTKAGILSRLREGYAVAVSLQYAKLPSYLKVQVNDFGHCVLLRGHRAEGSTIFVGYFDPLFEQSTQGTWAKFSDLAAALWDSGHTSSVTKYVPPVQRYTVHIAKGATVREYTLRKPTTGSGPWCIANSPDGGYGKDIPWTRGASHAPCLAPVKRYTCDGKSNATTVLVTDGAFKDEHIKVDINFGVTVSASGA